MNKFLIGFKNGTTLWVESSSSLSEIRNWLEEGKLIEIGGTIVNPDAIAFVKEGEK